MSVPPEATPVCPVARHHLHPVAPRSPGASRMTWRAAARRWTTPRRPSPPFSTRRRPPTGRCPCLPAARLAHARKHAASVTIPELFLTCACAHDSPNAIMVVSYAVRSVDDLICPLEDGPKTPALPRHRRCQARCYSSPAWDFCDILDLRRHCRNPVELEAEHRPAVRQCTVTAESVLRVTPEKLRSTDANRGTLCTMAVVR